MTGYFIIILYNHCYFWKYELSIIIISPYNNCLCSAGSQLAPILHFSVSCCLGRAWLGVRQLCSKICLLYYAAVLEKGTYHAQHLSLLCLIFFNYAHNNSKFAMISVIQLVIINIINFILLIFLNLMIKYY